MSQIQGVTSAERQALLVLDAASEVAAGLDVRRKALAGQSHPDHRQALLEAAERLVNLIILAGQRMSEDVGPDVREYVTGNLEKLRNRLMATGTGLVADRADKITRRVQDVTGGRLEYPLGLAGKLSMVLSGIEQAVEAMGGAHYLDEEVTAKLEEARQAVIRLQIIESERELEEL